MTTQHFWGFLALLPLALGLAAAADAATPGPATAPGGSDGIQPPVLVAQKTAKKKKKKKAPAGDEGGDFGPSDISPESGDNGVGVHREQEGVDVPYIAEIMLDTDLSFLTTTVKDSEDDPVKSTVIDVGVEWLFILGSFEIGPDVRYSSRTVATPVATKNPTTGQTTTEVLETKTSGYSVGGLFKWNFADIDHADLVPFAYAGAGYRAGETKSGDNDPTKSSGMVVRAGGGLNLFLDSNIAFNPRAEFRLETDKDEDDENAMETSTSGLKILVGVAVFF